MMIVIDDASNNAGDDNHDDDLKEVEEDGDDNDDCQLNWFEVIHMYPHFSSSLEFDAVDFDEHLL